MEIPLFKKFPGKVLLFGEYLVLHGERALAVPIKNFYGRLELKNEFQEYNIAPFIQYLGALPNVFLKQDLIEHVALDRLTFESNIPIGYGAGSSGALTAAVFDAFVDRYEGSLQEALASMEDFFHGSSSGLDPLVSFRREPSLPIRMEVLKHFYLIDTQIPRKTGPLVEIFKQKSEVQSFEALAKSNRKAIEACDTGNIEALAKAMGEISNFQFEHFKEMIPQAYMNIWSDSLAHEDISIKLCGAGGGGFLLLYSRAKEKVAAWAQENDLELIGIQI